jgi:hypothetical protein
MRITTEAWNDGWRIWYALNANALAWIALVVGGVLFTALSWIGDFDTRRRRWLGTRLSR